MNSAADLQKAILAALGTSDGLAVHVTGRILDHAPANVEFPYITFGRTSIHDWSTDTDDGAEHLFTLHVWSRGKGKKEALEIMELARQALHDAALALEEHSLVNLRLEFSDVRYDDRNEAYHGLMRFRAVTE